MGKLKTGSLKFLICFITGFIGGIIMGVSIFSMIVSYRMDTYYKQISYLENIIEDKDSRLERLEESINTQSLILKDIEITLEFSKEEIKDDIDKIDIEKNIREKYSILLGKEVKNIDSDILVEVVDKRIFKIEDREYRLQVKKLILTETLKVFVNVEKVD